MEDIKYFTNVDTGEVISTLPNVPIVDDVEVKTYDKSRYRYSYRKMLRSSLFLEFRYNSNQAFFLTLTYDDRDLPSDDDELLKRNIQLFMKRLRVWQERVLHVHSKLKYVSVVEHGSENDRLHHHMIIFNLDKRTVEFMTRSNSYGNNIWNHGFVYFKFVDAHKINYLLKYVFKQQYGGKMYKVLRSNHIGFYPNKIIGLCKFNKDGTFRVGRYLYRIPIYLLRKVYNPLFKKYRSILANYHLSHAIPFNYKDVLLSAIALSKDGMFRYIPYGEYKNKVQQIEFNRINLE